MSSGGELQSNKKYWEKIKIAILGSVGTDPYNIPIEAKKQIVYSKGKQWIGLCLP